MSGDRLGGVEAALLGAAAFLLLPTVGYALQVGLGPVPGIIASEGLVVLLPVILALRWSRMDASSALGLRAPTAAQLAGTVLATGGCSYLVAAVLEPLQERFAPMPAPLRAQLRDLVLPVGGLRPLAVDLIALALVPAIAEETLFRGALLRAFGRTRATQPAAIVATALAFGCFHFSLYKLAPTAALGVLLGVIALRGGLACSIAAHLLNNTAVVLLVRAGREELEPPPGLAGVAAVALAIAASVLGLTILGRRRRKD